MNNQLTIVIVDDSKIICDRITSLLLEIPKTGKVFCGYTFKEGIQLIETQKPDVAILDINLPENNGIELLRMIKERKYPVKTVIMMTEDASELNREKCKQLGANYFLNKFTDFEKVTDIVQEIR